MKKFQFKLEGLLKVKEFKEKKIKIELGQMLKEIGAVEDRIAQLKKDVDETYDVQDQLLKDATSGNMLQFIPYVIKGKKEHIKHNEEILAELKSKYEIKRHELAMARGEVKVIENFKDKKKEEWTKLRDKKELETIEELVIMRKLGEGN